jgi:hypothetical protein
VWFPTLPIWLPKAVLGTRPETNPCAPFINSAYSYNTKILDMPLGPQGGVQLNFDVRPWVIYRFYAYNTRVAALLALLLALAYTLRACLADLWLCVRGRGCTPRDGRGTFYSPSTRQPQRSPSFVLILLRQRFWSSVHRGARRLRTRHYCPWRIAPAQGQILERHSCSGRGLHGEQVAGLSYTIQQMHLFMCMVAGSLFFCC